MIDTVILSIPKNEVTTMKDTPHEPNRWSLQSKGVGYEKFVNNPSKKDKELGYFPRLTGYQRKSGKSSWNAAIRIEFSVPKLIYENNVDELTDNQFEKVISTLQQRMLTMGVKVTKEKLRDAAVTAVHYSKNIGLENGFTSQYVISELNKIDLNKCFDLTRSRFMNDGQSLYAYTQSHSFVIYDKIADLQRGKKRSIDRDQTSRQISLFAPLTKKEKPKEILRLEVRLSQKRKMNSLFKQLGFEQNPTFKDVFDTRKSKAVVLHYWNTMIGKNSSVLFAHNQCNKDLLKQILLTGRNIKAKDAIYKTGLIALLQEGNGMRELRSNLSKHANDRTWYRIASDAKKIGTTLEKLEPRDWYHQVEKALRNFEVFRVEM